MQELSLDTDVLRLEEAEVCNSLLYDLSHYVKQTDNEETDAQPEEEQSLDVGVPRLVRCRILSVSSADRK